MTAANIREINCRTGNPGGRENSLNCGAVVRLLQGQVVGELVRGMAGRETWEGKSRGGTVKENMEEESNLV